MTDQQLPEPFGHCGAICRSLSEIYTQWCVRGPSLEASSAIAAMSQEHAGYSKMLDRLARGATLAPCPIPGLRTSPDTWPELIGIAGTAELALVAALAEWRATADGATARNLTKMAQELGYHARFFRGWFQELDGDTSRAGFLFDRARRDTERDVWAWLRTPGIRPPRAPDAPAPGAFEQDTTPPSDHQVCPRCGAQDARLLSSFGPSLMTSQFRCGSCDDFFESVRWTAPTSMEPTVAGTDG